MEYVEDFYTPFNISSEQELQSYENGGYKEAMLLFEKHPRKAHQILEQLIFNMDVLKIICDTYVWQRVNVVKKGINKAITEQETKKKGYSKHTESKKHSIKRQNPSDTKTTKTITTINRCNNRRGRFSF